MCCTQTMSKLTLTMDNTRLEYTGKDAGVMYNLLDHVLPCFQADMVGEGKVFLCKGQVLKCYLEGSQSHDLTYNKRQIATLLAILAQRPQLRAFVQQFY